MTHLGVKNPVWQGAVAASLDPDAQDFINAIVLSPGGVSNPGNMHDQNPATRAAITNVGNNSFTLDLGSIATRPLKASVGQFRSPYSGGNNWFLEYSTDNSNWTQGDTFSTTANGVTEMDAGSVSFRYCRCRYVISFATWNSQAYMGTINNDP
jgi:hypothetical protein